MGQKLREDKILNLQQSGGNISLGADSVLTIGGQQYTLASSIQVALPSLSANTLYMVYAVLSGGVPTLVISQNVNSVGPSGYTAWKLVGAFYSDSQISVGFGSFVTIEGIPESQLIAQGETQITSGTPPTKGTRTVDTVKTKRMGEYLFYKVEYLQTAAGTQGAGTYRFVLPGVTIDSTKQRTGGGSSVSGEAIVGDGFVTGNLPNALNVFCFSTTELALIMDDNAFVNGDTNNHLGLSSVKYSFYAMVPVQGWSNTPLKDL